MEMKPHSRAFKGIWIPAEIWLNKKLSVMEKIFLVEIDSLDNERGCFASNAHFSDFFGISKGRCTQIIKELEAKKLIKITLLRENNQIKRRTIRVVNKLNTPSENIKQGYLENDEGSNTKINNTTNNKGGKVLPNVEDKNSEEKREKKEARTILINQAFDFFWEAWPTKKNKQKALKSFVKICGSKNDEAIEGLTNTLCADIDKRLQSNDFGFDRMHATTYLNNKRWEDDISAGDYQ